MGYSMKNIFMILTLFVTLSIADYLKETGLM